ncbi:MAG: CRISPR-associated protein CasA/Cse1 [Candidatus Accumulibacter regalis]|jgi:CRISPR system Cascade subunit CasA|uniref:CRISPR-associated protein CasA/Cse1 n=1 Tax=Accumulibacter regalis TaxID=522306 RepID=A0A011P5X8_ACCRE|nr:MULTISPECIES: type I-E CRISPR-associated protein Cse1/CasA [unclassified Candidatus Accumulibacter]EXI90373.1 MAG: CRISPR-associated protein CasA/Cse1 [Candidatus Accumulibacter regalis]
MNLLHEPWMPVRRRDGSRAWIAPNQLSDPDILAFDADRPDFNGALAQFSVGLLQTSTPVDSGVAWDERFENPPSAVVLSEWFAPFAEAFELDAKGARFMQDFSLTADEGSFNEIGALLIDAPGENALKNNSDHFVKRGRVSGMCAHCAASAVLTLQINAPAGGVGNRTGLRGGGPLTTLLLSMPLDGQPRSLWDDLWLNVRDQRGFLALCGDAGKSALHFRFPWMSDIAAIQRAGGETAPVQVHPHHVFWAMPRRIRLDFETVASGDCDVCGRSSERLVQRYVSKNYGFNYKGPWNHPLSPYYEATQGWLPMHPQPGGFAFRHWLGWALGQVADKKKQRCASVVQHALADRRGQLRLWAFGYDMDNMKARCWYEATLPLYGLADCDADAQGWVGSQVDIWIAGADLAASYLRSAVKDAWFSSEARGNFSAIDATFWSSTEAAFYDQLRDLIDLARQNLEGDMLAVRESWHRVLIITVDKLFDTIFVGAGQVERQRPQRVAKAFRQLKKNMRGPKVRQALSLPALATEKPTSRNPAAEAAAI